jgi:soluble lytic murein transglycosylase-like protein
MTTVIDALVVTLSLKPQDFKKGVEDVKKAQAEMGQAAQTSAKTSKGATDTSTKQERLLANERRKQAAEEKKRQDEKARRNKAQQVQEKKDTDASIDRLKSLGLAATGAVLGFNSIKGAVEAYLNTTSQMAGLGRIAPTVGADVALLDKLGDAYAQVGSNAADAQGDVAKLAHAQFSYAINAPDAMAGWMRRLGVNLFDEHGQARNKEQVESDIATALKSKTKDLQTQAMYAREMGLSEGFIQLYLVKQADERERILASAEKTAKASKESAAQAVKEEQARARLKNNVKGVLQNITGAINPLVTRAENAVANAMENASPTANDRLLKTLGLTAGPVAGGKAFGPAASPYLADFAAAEKRHHLPSGLLAGIAHRESNFNPAAVSSKGAVGLMQLEPKYFPGAGKNAGADIETAAAEMERLIKNRRKTYGQQEALALALADYNRGQGNVNKAISKGTTLPAETRAYVPAVSRYLTNSTGSTAGATSTSTTNVTIQTMTITTQATDAKGIAATLPAALKSQGIVNQANTGMN